MAGLLRYIATVETAKHRVFQFLDAAILPDNMLVCLASDDSFHLGVLSSRQNMVWSLRAGGWLGVGNDPRYSKSRVFDPFPFPIPTPDQRTCIGEFAEELDRNRKDVLAAHPDLTLTGLYNLRDKVLRGDPLDLVEQDQRARGRVDLIAELHRRIDEAVADAYGWPADLSDEQIVARLVALNAERRAEEKRGHVQWLRPDYQLGRAKVASISPADRPEQIEALLPDARARKPAFPRDAVGQTAAVFDALRSGGALTAAAIAARYAGGRRAEPRIAATLAALVRLGHVSLEGDAHRLRRAA